MKYSSSMSRKSHKRLAKLIKEFGLTSAQVASLCRVELGTVNCWRKDSSGSGHRTMSDGSLELLELKLGKRELQLHKQDDRGTALVFSLSV